MEVGSICHKSCACVFPPSTMPARPSLTPLFFPSSPSSFRVSLLAQAGLELETILQPQPSKSWDYETPCSRHFLVCSSKMWGHLPIAKRASCPLLREQVREPVTCLRKQLFLTFCGTLSCLVNLVSSSVKWDNKHVAYSYSGSSCSVLAFLWRGLETKLFLDSGAFDFSRVPGGGVGMLSL